MRRITAAGTPASTQVLPTGTPDQILKGAIGLQGLTEKAGAGEVTVTEGTAGHGNVYDRSTRSLMFAVVRGLNQTDPELAADAQALAQVLGIDKQALATDLDRQRAAWDGFRDCWSIHTSVGTGLRILDGTRRLARSIVEADVETARAKLSPAAQTQLDDDMQDYRDAVAEDKQGRLATRKLGQNIAASTETTLGQFQDRSDLLDTLERLSANETLPWDVLVKAGATLDQITEETHGPSSVDGAALPHLVSKGNQRAQTRQ